MTRILVAALCALGLALLPVMVGHAQANPMSSSAECTMKDMPHDGVSNAGSAHEDMRHARGPKSSNHERMNCCIAACQAPFPVAVTSGVVLDRALWSASLNIFDRSREAAWFGMRLQSRSTSKDLTFSY